MDNHISDTELSNLKGKAKLLPTRNSETRTVGASTSNRHLTRTSHPANQSIKIHHHKAIPDAMMGKSNDQAKISVPHLKTT